MTAEHYKPVGEALIWTLRQGLGDGFTLAVEGRVGRGLHDTRRRHDRRRAKPPEERAARAHVRLIGGAPRKKQKGPATLSAEPPWITPGKIEFQGKGTLRGAR